MPNVLLGPIFWGIFVSLGVPFKGLCRNPPLQNPLFLKGLSSLHCLRDNRGLFLAGDAGTGGAQTQSQGQSSKQKTWGWPTRSCGFTKTESRDEGGREKGRTSSKTEFAHVTETQKGMLSFGCCFAPHAIKLGLFLPTMA